MIPEAERSVFLAQEAELQQDTGARMNRTKKRLVGDARLAGTISETMPHSCLTGSCVIGSANSGLFACVGAEASSWIWVYIA